MSGIQRLSHAFAAGVSVDSAAILGRILRKIVDISVIRRINASMRPIVVFIMVCGQCTPDLELNGLKLPGFARFWINVVELLFFW